MIQIEEPIDLPNGSTVTHFSVHQDLDAAKRTASSLRQGMTKVTRTNVVPRKITALGSSLEVFVVVQTTDDKDAFAEALGYVDWTAMVAGDTDETN